MPADLANAAAAVSAGYSKTQIDMGAGKSPRYRTVLEKYVTGDSASGSPLRAYGESDVSAAAADTQAVNALNKQRQHRYGTDGTNVNKGSRSGATLTTDLH